MPAAYGMPDTAAGLLPWSWAEERLIDARHYWVCTLRVDGQPHAVPVWGVWHAGALYVGGDSGTRTCRNLLARPAVAVHVERDGDMVMLEGRAEPVRDTALLAQLSTIGAIKYGIGDPAAVDAAQAPDPASTELGNEPGGHVTFAVRPSVAFGWGGGFPADMTRWRFPRNRVPPVDDAPDTGRR